MNDKTMPPDDHTPKLNVEFVEILVKEDEEHLPRLYIRLLINGKRWDAPLPLCITGLVEYSADDCRQVRPFGNDEFDYAGMRFRVSEMTQHHDGIVTLAAEKVGRRRAKEQT